MSVTGVPLSEIQHAEEAGQLPRYAKRDIALVRGEGCYLFDSDGRRYLDAMSNYGIAVLGHADPGFAQAMTDQLHTLTTGHQSFYNDVRAALLTEIATIAPPSLTRSFLSNSGTEAIEAALKLARVATGRAKIVAAKRAYHGRTLGALAVTADPKYRTPFAPFTFEVIHVPFGHGDALAAAVDNETAAIIVEPIQGEAGVFPAPPGYLQTAREIATQHGALLIADEVQTGFRVGAPFAIAQEDVKPDILATAKALANGIPIGLTLTTEHIGAGIPPGMHGSTFGGNPLACRAAFFTLTALRERDLYAQSTTIGDEIVSRIRHLDSPKVRQVRGRGMMIGIELKARATPALKALQQAGVLALPANPTTIRLLPPLIWQSTQVDELIEALAPILT